MIHGPVHDPKFMLQTALIGFDAAHDRVGAVWGRTTDVHELFVPLLEALWWTVTVDDGFEGLADIGLSNRVNRDAYRIARNGDQDGRVLRAVRYARDRCGHQRALMTGVRLPTIPFTLPMTLGPVVCWRPSSDLPAPDPRFSNPVLQTEYDGLLSGQPVPAVLGSVRRWFEQERTRAGL